eukprot:gene14234-19099_t
MGSFDDRSLFIGDLSVFCTEDDLKNVFASFGPVEEVKIKRSKTTNISLCYGFITFEYGDSALTALKEMNGALVCGRMLRINWAMSSHNNEEMDSHDSKKTKVYDFNHKDTSIVTCIDSKEFTINEAYLKNTFSLHGNVLHVVIKRYAINSESGENSGYAFLYFEKSLDGIAAAVKTANTFQDTVVSRIRFKASITKALAVYIQKLNNQLELNDKSAMRNDYSSLSISPRAMKQQSSLDQFNQNPHYFHLQASPYVQQQQGLVQQPSYPYQLVTVAMPLPSGQNQQYWPNGHPVNYGIPSNVTTTTESMAYISPPVYYSRHMLARSPNSNYQSQYYNNENNAYNVNSSGFVLSDPNINPSNCLPINQSVHKLNYW